MRFLLLALLALPTVSHAREIADLGCNAEGYAQRGYLVKGFAGEDRADVGRQGVYVASKLNALCDAALRDCARKFYDVRMGEYECRVVRAYMVLNGNETDYSEYNGRSLAGGGHHDHGGHGGGGWWGRPGRR